MLKNFYFKVPLVLKMNQHFFLPWIFIRGFTVKKLILRKITMFHFFDKFFKVFAVLHLFDTRFK